MTPSRFSYACAPLFAARAQKQTARKSGEKSAKAKATEMRCSAKRGRSSFGHEQVMRLVSVTRKTVDDRGICSGGNSSCRVAEEPRARPLCRPAPGRSDADSTVRSATVDTTGSTLIIIQK